MSNKKSKSNRPVIENKKAKHDYFIEETFDCGIVLKGNEVKSLLKGAANINAAWCEYHAPHLMITNMHISKYDNANNFDTDERRNRTLLLHKNEINKILKKINMPGYTAIPLKLYWDRQYAKVQIGICVGKHNYDKRNDLKNKTIERDIARYV